jgi:hypothetical protein
VQADAHDRLARAECGKDPGLDFRFDPVLDQIRHRAKNGLTLLMVLHNFFSKRHAPL